MGGRKRLVSFRLEESLLERIDGLHLDPDTRTFKIEKTLKKGLRLM